MKKIISIILAVVMAFAFTVSAFALSVNDFDALTNEFPVSTAANGMKYAAYEPKTENGKTYPLVVYIHGLGHAWNDVTFKQSGLTYWASDEMQAKFNEGGAYLLMPKIPEYVISAAQSGKVFSLIEEYVGKHADTIDMSQIYIMGGSAGGGLAWRVLIAHSDYFKKAVILCGDKFLSKENAKAVSDTPIWMISAKTDPLVWYFLFSAPNWNMLMKNSNVKGECRHTVFANRVQLPDGSNAIISHLLAKTIGYNLCRLADKQPLNGMKTVDANGNSVDVSFENGIIEWLQK
ncbi:MAG: hypothetical protein MJ177_08850 [Clostridia bacterium]|nr:hypothetical protein [Clostridia bacterium]